VTNELAAALKTGDEAQLTQAFTKAVSSAVQAATSGKGAQATQAVDVAAITEQVRQQIAIDSVLAQSRADYPQLYADPDVEAVAASKISRLQAEGKPFAEALETVQTELATKFKWDKASQQGRPAVAPDTSRRDEKLKRKEGSIFRSALRTSSPARRKLSPRA
jgi:hypothetical protein